MIGLVGIGVVVLAPFVVVRELAGARIIRKALLGRDSHLDGPRFDELPLDVVVGLGVEVVECQFAFTVGDLLGKHRGLVEPYQIAHAVARVLESSRDVLVQAPIGLIGDVEVRPVIVVGGEGEASSLKGALECVGDLLLGRQALPREHLHRQRDGIGAR